MWVWTLKLYLRKEDLEIKTVLRDGGDTASLSCPGETKKCSWFLVFQASRPHMCYYQFVVTLSNVTRSLHNHLLLGIKTVTYQLETAELNLVLSIGDRRSHKS